MDEDLKVDGVVVRPIPPKPENFYTCLCAKNWLSKAEGGDLYAMFSLANCYRSPETQPLFTKNTENHCYIKPEIYSAWMGAAATRGFAPAQYAYGTAWLFGSGFPAKNEDNAINWWAQAANQGFGIAYYSLGDAYEEGIGRPKNLKKALALFREAKKFGDNRANERILKLETNEKK